MRIDSHGELHLGVFAFILLCAFAGGLIGTVPGLWLRYTDSPEFPSRFWGFAVATGLIAGSFIGAMAGFTTVVTVAYQNRHGRHGRRRGDKSTQGGSQE